MDAQRDTHVRAVTHLRLQYAPSLVQYVRGIQREFCAKRASFGTGRAQRYDFSPEFPLRVHAVGLLVQRDAVIRRVDADFAYDVHGIAVTKSAK